MSKESERILERLKSHYKDDAEALELIEQTKADIEYLEQKGQKEKAQAHLNNFEAFLHDWY